MDRPEFSLIDWIRSQVTDRPPVVVGIGDDAAVLQNSGRECLVATDMLMEGVDFTFPPASPYMAGRKALAVNLSDIAAMGGRPTSAFVSVALPRARGTEFARELHAGLLDLAATWDVVIAGGDTNSWNGPLVINVAVLGEPWGDRSILRSGALPGDLLFATGEFGGSLAGHHLAFEPRIREAERIVSLVPVHAMIDVSDGLAADVHHLLDQSRVGAILNAAAIPIRDTALAGDGPPLQRALGDGEDFELVLAVGAEQAEALTRGWTLPTRLTCIGRVVSEPGCWLESADGTQVPLPPLGWTHALD